MYALTIRLQNELPMHRLNHKNSNRILLLPKQKTFEDKKTARLSKRY